MCCQSTARPCWKGQEKRGKKQTVHSVANFKTLKSPPPITLSWTSQTLDLQWCLSFPAWPLSSSSQTLENSGPILIRRRCWSCYNMSYLVVNCSSNKNVLILQTGYANSPGYCPWRNCAWSFWAHKEKKTHNKDEWEHGTQINGVHIKTKQQIGIPHRQGRISRQNHLSF